MLWSFKLCVAIAANSQVTKAVILTASWGILGVVRLEVGAALSKSKRSLYLETDTEEIDSSEHGGPPGAKSTTCDCGWVNKPSLKIVNGIETGVNEMPFLAALANCQSRFQFCGGSLITNYHVITAAHCTQPRLHSLGETCVLLGEHHLFRDDETNATQTVHIRKAIQHPGYDTESLKHDISILVLAKKIDFNRLVGPVCLPSPIKPTSLVKEYVKIIGWGNMATGGESSETPNKVNVRVIPLESCQKVYDFLDIVTPTQLCTYANKKASCQGDSGGPVVWVDPDTNRYTLVGVVSFATECANHEPTVHTDLASYYGWITDHVKATKQETEVCTKRN